MTDPYHSLYVGLKCQYCGKPIMTKKDIDNLSDAYRDRERTDKVKALLNNLKCRECGKNVSDQFIWNYQEYLAKERDEWRLG